MSATATYKQLLTEVLPARISTDEEYDSLHARFGELLARKKLSAAEEKLYDLLKLLLLDYDNRHALPPGNSSPSETLTFLVEHSGKKAAELLEPVFCSRSHVNEAINGTRKISADQARKLGKLFSVNPGIFI